MAKTKEERREINKISQKNWFAKNKERGRDYLRTRRAERRVWFEKITSTLSCTKCGENHQGCLDFHHRDPSTKEDTIGRMLGTLKSKESILEEIKKCEVLCANCHRKLHWEEK